MSFQKKEKKSNIYPTHKKVANKLQTNLRPGVFLDISKAFGKVWHPGLIHKFRSFGMKVLIITS